MSMQFDKSVNPVPRTIWPGASGTRYEFEHFAINGVSFNPVSGVYIFCKQGIDQRSTRYMSERRTTLGAVLPMNFFLIINGIT
jgi:hypothetical protein